MRIPIVLSLMMFLGIQIIDAQSKKAQDLQAIKSMCGCYEVKFNFIETFNYSVDPEYKASKEKHDRALEWVQLVEDDQDKVVMQHLLLVGTAINPRIIKHWRQDWLYENKDFYMFHADRNWKYQDKTASDVSGQWTQKVYQVDDSPRYEGTATWVHVDGKSYWENATDAPLPRREYTTRDDYNVTIRQNRHEITSYGWAHEQDNRKVVRAEGKEDFVLAEEKGMNTYTKVDKAKCEAAAKWWEENKEMWSTVRKNWDKVFGKKRDLSLKSKVDDKPLFMHLFSLDAAAKPKEIKQIIADFVEK